MERKDKLFTKILLISDPFNIVNGGYTELSHVPDPVDSDLI
jgi:hypothetical protein